MGTIASRIYSDPILLFVVVACLLPTVFFAAIWLERWRNKFATKKEVGDQIGAVQTAFKEAVERMTSTLESNAVFHERKYNEVVAQNREALRTLDRSWTENLNLVHENTRGIAKSQERVIQEVGEFKGLLSGSFNRKRKKRGAAA